MTRSRLYFLIGAIKFSSLILTCLGFLSIGDQQIAKRRGEKFKRIKCSTLARLLKESLAEESIYSLQNAAAAGAAGAVPGQDDEIKAADSISQVGASMASGKV